MRRNFDNFCSLILIDVDCWQRKSLRKDMILFPSHRFFYQAGCEINGRPIKCISCFQTFCHLAKLNFSDDEQTVSRVLQKAEQLVSIHCDVL